MDGQIQRREEKVERERERRKDERIKDLHSKANTAREREYSAEETVSLRRAG